MNLKDLGLTKEQIAKIEGMMSKELKKAMMLIVSTGASDVFMPKEKYQAQSELRQAQRTKMERAIEDFKANMGIKK